MRVARALIEDTARPVIALERDGALYDVGELDRVFGRPLGTSLAGDAWADSSDFHTRAAALGGAGLRELDARLRAGDRPSTARILPGTSMRLPPCDGDRAQHVEVAPHALGEGPRFRLGAARAMLGHGSLVPIFGDRAFAQLALAVVLGDSLSSATAEDAERAVFGVTLLNGWASSESPASDGYLTRYTAPQLGPGLVTLDEIGDAGDTGSLGALRAEIRVDGVPVRRLDTRGQPFTLGEALASISRSFELRAGDVVSLGVLRAGTIEVPFGATVELAVERIGRLAGIPVRAT